MLYVLLRHKIKIRNKVENKNNDIIILSVNLSSSVNVIDLELDYLVSL